MNKRKYDINRRVVAFRPSHKLYKMIAELAEFGNNSMSRVVELALMRQIPGIHAHIPKDRIEEVQEKLWDKQEEQ